MMQPESLTDYVRVPTCHCGITDMAPDGFPICHECWSRFIGQPRKPVWIQRMEAKQLPNKDFTGKGPDAA